jgi:flavin reductase (DIM6/NTAB) family NADH-FMN oxidoreductase RutF
MADAPGIDPLELRRALGQFATGVTVITVRHGDVIHGMTANSFTAVSLDPPLVLFCVAKSARMARFVTEAHGFAISILAADQQDVSRLFAGSKKEQLGDSVPLRPGQVAPLIPGALASLSCSIDTVHEGGDHWIVVGRVVKIEHGDPREPLVFFRGRYHDVVEQDVSGVPESSELWTNDAIRIYHDEWSAGEVHSQSDDSQPAPW